MTPIIVGQSQRQKQGRNWKLTTENAVTVAMQAPRNRVR